MHQNKIQELINYYGSSNRRQGAKDKEANETKELWFRLKRKKDNSIFAARSNGLLVEPR